MSTVYWFFLCVQVGVAVWFATRGFYEERHGMSKWELRTEGCTMPLARDIESGIWVGHSEVADYFVAQHNADCDAYEAKIAELEEDVEYMDRKRFENRAFAIHYRKRCFAAQDKLARIAALVKPVPVADLVEAGTEAPKLLAERQAAIRAILEDESNE